MELRVATFNIAGGVDADDRFYSRRGTARTAARVAKARVALDEIAQLAAEQRWDVLALQEVDVCHNGTNTLHEAETLARQLGMHHAYLPSFDYDLLGRWTVTTGIATLSRLPIVASREHRFSQRRRTIKRRLMNRVLGAKAALEVTLEGGLRIVNAHLTHDDDRQKEHELETLLTLCSSHEPSALLGDLNTVPPMMRAHGMREAAHFATDRCFEILERFRFQSDPRVACTYPSIAADLKLDYILLFATGATLSPETVHPRTGSSNHLPVSLTITLPE